MCVEGGADREREIRERERERESRERAHNDISPATEGWLDKGADTVVG